MTPEQWAEILEYFGHTCAYCFATGVKLTRDHVIPLARGGRDEPDNVVPACGPCNCEKNATSLLIVVGQTAGVMVPPKRVA